MENNHYQSVVEDIKIIFTSYSYSPDMIIVGDIKFFTESIKLNNGMVYQGECVNILNRHKVKIQNFFVLNNEEFIPQGKGKIENSKVSYTGKFYNGIPNEKGKIRYLNGDVY